MKGTNGFTLTEVLITLAVVGIVSAMTLPTLITNINDKVKPNQTEVFEKKLIRGLNLTKSAGDLNSTYSSTVDFLENGLGKHFKIAKICGPTNMRECVPYDNIKFDRDTNKEDNYEVKNINTSKKLNLKTADGFEDVASFVTGDGSVIIASYKKDCLVDSGELDKNISECFAGIYDLNGSRKPNKLGKDIQTFNGGGLDVPAVLATLGGVKIISNAQVYTGIQTSVYCKDGEPIKIYKEAGVNLCCTGCDSNGGDRWAAAAKGCADIGGHLPTEKQLADMANVLYKGVKASAGDGLATVKAGKDADGNRTKIASGEPVPTPLSGLGSSWNYLWSSAENISNSSKAYLRNYYGNYTSRDSALGRNHPSVKAICVSD